MTVTQLLTARAAGRTNFAGITLAPGTGSLRRASLFGCNFTKANLSQADLRQADLRTAQLDEANLTDASLAYAHCTFTSLHKAKLIQAIAEHVDFSGADLTKADLTKAYCAKATFIRADLSAATMLKAYLCDADLRAATLKRTPLDPNLDSQPNPNLDSQLNPNSNPDPFDELLVNANDQFSMCGLVEANYLPKKFEYGVRYKSAHFSIDVESLYHPGFIVRPWPQAEQYYSILTGHWGIKTPSICQGNLLKHLKEDWRAQLPVGILAVLFWMKEGFADFKQILRDVEPLLYVFWS